MRRCAPDEAAIARFIGPKRHRSADNRTEGDWSEIASVKALGDKRIQDEDFISTEPLTSLPSWQRPIQMIAVLRHADFIVIDEDTAIETADRLTCERQNMFQQQHPARQEAAVCEGSGRWVPAA